IDYLVDKTRNKVYVNEINTVPGSLAYYLFEPLGLSYGDILEKVINTAIERAENLSFKKNTFDTGVLASFKGGTKSSLKM
ncbi:MAG: D-alanine--D-alanine ligase, partial [Clostridia bacterium]|nr:D-alanine--D-alanine ligase [Clostridia bacterium]